MFTLQSVVIFVVLWMFAAIPVQCNEPWPSPEFSAVVNPVATKCIGITGIDEATINDVKNGNFPADETKLKEHLLCIFKDMDLINTKFHDFEYWKIMNMATKDMKKLIFEMGKGCLHIKGEDYAQASLDFVKCLYKANPIKFSFMF